VQDNKRSVKFSISLQLRATVSRRLYRDSHSAPPCTVRQNEGKLVEGIWCALPNRELTLRAMVGEYKRFHEDEPLFLPDMS
jgi:hypothetical protein